jgi:hypothetical protein
MKRVKKGDKTSGSKDGDLDEVSAGDCESNMDGSGKDGKNKNRKKSKKEIVEPGNIQDNNVALQGLLSQHGLQGLSSILSPPLPQITQLQQDTSGQQTQQNFMAQQQSQINDSSFNLPDPQSFGQMFPQLQGVQLPPQLQGLVSQNLSSQNSAFQGFEHLQKHLGQQNIFAQNNGQSFQHNALSNINLNNQSNDPISHQQSLNIQPPPQQAMQQQSQQFSSPDPLAGMTIDSATLQKLQQALAAAGGGQQLLQALQQQQASASFQQPQQPQRLQQPRQQVIAPQAALINQPPPVDFMRQLQMIQAANSAVSRESAAGDTLQDNANNSRSSVGETRSI